MQITATLHDAVVEFGERGEVLFTGYVQSAAQNNWLDGQRLTIGPILAEPEPGIFVTPLGVYRVIEAPSAAGERLLN